MSKKYEFTGETMEFNGTGATLHRIKAIKDFGTVKSGDIGGWIESEDNLSHDGDAWVADNAVVCGSASVSGNAIVRDHAT